MTMWVRIPKPHARDLLEQVAFWHGVPVQLIYARRQDRKTSAARHDAVVAIALNCQIQGRPIYCAEIGRIIKRHHATILHSLEVRGVRLQKQQRP
jgi:chromosomal replication initiation ATPase DnaA